MTIGASGLRSSCPSIARNSSFARLASSAAARAAFSAVTSTTVATATSIGAVVATDGRGADLDPALGPVQARDAQLLSRPRPRRAARARWAIRPRREDDRRERSRAASCSAPRRAPGRPSVRQMRAIASFEKTSVPSGGARHDDPDGQPLEHALEAPLHATRLVVEARPREGVGAVLGDRRHEGALLGREAPRPPRAEREHAEHAIVAHERERAVRAERLASSQRLDDARGLGVEVSLALAPDGSPLARDARGGQRGVGRDVPERLQDGSPSFRARRAGGGRRARRSPRGPRPRPRAPRCRPASASCAISSTVAADESAGGELLQALAAAPGSPSRARRGSRARAPAPRDGRAR